MRLLVAALTTAVVLFIYVIVVILKMVTWQMPGRTAPLSCMFTYEIHFFRDVFCSVCSLVLPSPLHSLLLFANLSHGGRGEGDVQDNPRCTRCTSKRISCERDLGALARPCRWSLGLPFILSEGRRVQLVAKHRISVMVLSGVLTQS